METSREILGGACSDGESYDIACASLAVNSVRKDKVRGWT